MKTDKEITELVESCKPMIWHMIKRLGMSTHPEKDDIAADCVLTLVKCAQKYDPSKGIKFASYCYRAIYNTVLDANALNRTVSVKSHKDYVKLRPIPVWSLDAPKDYGPGTQAKDVNSYVNALEAPRNDDPLPNHIREALDPIECEIMQIVWQDSSQKHGDPGWEERLRELLRQYHKDNKARTGTGNISYAKKTIFKKVRRYYLKNGLLR